MMQGDACYLGVHILNNAGNPVTPGDIRDLEITFGPHRKRYSAGQLNYRDGIWFLPLSQAETFAVPAQSVPAQVRVHWLGGVVEGMPIHGLTMACGLSREVI